MGVWDRHMNEQHSRLQHEFKLSCSERDALRRQQEILIDLGFGLGNHWAQMDTKLTSDLMDMVEGSRGLADRVKAWAVEFDKDWEARPEDQKQDYLIDIDKFGDDKLDALLEELKHFDPATGSGAVLQTVVGVQVVPVVERRPACDEGGLVVEAQIGGPTDETTHWSIYERLSDGRALWVADAINERMAEILGNALAAFHHVEIEAQHWKVRDGS